MPETLFDKLFIIENTVKERIELRCHEAHCRWHAAIENDSLRAVVAKACEHLRVHSG